jgi:uncharacterized membrane protein YedE/YeeE
MRYILFLLTGILFGITMFKSEAASWFRIYEMFHFDSFHMYGIIGSAVFFGILVVQIIKRFSIKTPDGKTIHFYPKDRGVARNLLGGIIFGLGWALAGACPGPIFTLMGAGYFPIFVVFGGAFLGTLLYGILRKHLPH